MPEYMNDNICELKKHRYDKLCADFTNILAEVLGLDEDEALVTSRKVHDEFLGDLLEPSKYVQEEKSSNNKDNSL